MTTNQVRNFGLLAAGAIAGSVLAATLTASAAGSDSTATPSYSTVPPGAPGGPSGGFGGSGGSRPVRSDETTPSDDIVATLTKRAKAAVDGGTVIRVETDAGDAAYEAHMQKADGTLVTVKFDKDLDVVEVQDGMGLGGHG